MKETLIVWGRAVTCPHLVIDCLVNNSLRKKNGHSPLLFHKKKFFLDFFIC